MTLQSGKNRHGWRVVATGVLAGGAMAAGVIAGFGAPAALADPADPTTQATPPPMTADEALAIIYNEYDMGAGGGQLSTLIHDVMKLRALGFKPSNGNKEAITKALDYRPNQAPLIAALKDTLAYQRKMQALQQNQQPSQQGGFNIGGPGNPNSTGTGIIPGTGISEPVG
jgi:hypothetical protein